MEFHAWQILGAVGLILVIAEIFIPGFVLFPIGLAALVTATVSVWLEDWRAVLAVLAAVEIATFFLFRHFFPRRPSQDTGVEGMIGKECEVIARIAGKTAGYVKLFGDEWAAQSEKGETFEVGSRVVITRLEGNRVWVRAV
ncbi:NfeD family protein [bacterium]|nr:NfeD family protein [bacterium]